MPEENYNVQDGDCVSSVAFSRGFFWETLWNHGKNAELKSKRKDPNILKEGDVLHIPELTPKEESCAQEKRHKFKLKGVPAKLKLRLMRTKVEEEKDEGGGADSGGGGGLGGLGGSVPGAPGGSGGDSADSDLADPEYKPPKEQEEPIKNAPYIFEVDGVRVDEGQTDGDGCVEIPLTPNARKGLITVNKGKDDEKVFPLDLGAMDPVDEPAGVRKRLINLGFFCQPEGPADSEDLEAALRKFQDKNKLEVSGRIDDPTKNKLKELHGS